ncbi:unnamed protein product [Effrenium voratum]|uniref:Uncharacterized protein n=1 Tax=Effrenium voratum TaxID=2562239 RepID=A0AA36MHA9_9DINO|nr:unnamed protein product [Effrenium voratum]
MRAGSRGLFGDAERRFSWCWALLDSALAEFVGEKKEPFLPPAVQRAVCPNQPAGQERLNKLPSIFMTIPSPFKLPLSASHRPNFPSHQPGHGFARGLVFGLGSRRRANPNCQAPVRLV